MGKINRGGAFLFPSILILIIIVIPLTVLEMGTGQFYKTSLQEIYKKHHPKYIGNVIVIFMTSGTISSFYIYLMSYCLLYCFESVFGDLPWLGVGQDELLIKLKDYFQNNLLEISDVF